MGVIIPQVVTENKASGAQDIPYSVSFDASKLTSLQRTTTRAASNAAASFSVWVKLNDISTTFRRILTIEGSGGSDFVFTIAFVSNQVFVYDSDQGGSDANAAQSGNVLRDPNAWYHIFYARTAGGTDGTIYINGVEKTKQTTNATNIDLFSRRHDIGQRRDNTGHFDGLMSQLYVIDGQRLDPTDFGFTDPLTNTWRPKKYTGTFGTMGYYLPFDGITPVGEDQSGLGNDFLSKGLGLANLDISTGAKPILNTSSGANIVSGSVRTFRKTYAVTVQNDSGNKYFLDGVNNTGTTIPLYRGGVYTFDQSDASNSGHPLRFATAADANGSTEYSDGVTQSGTPGSANAFTRIVVPHNAPDTLHYYCTNHNGMGGPTANTTDDNITDPYAWKCVLALPLVNNSNDVSNFINPSSTAKTVTLNGNAAVTTDNDSNKNFYGSGFTLDGSGDFLKVTDNADFTFGTDDWTIELYAYADAVGSFISWGPDSDNRIDIGPRISFDTDGYRLLLRLSGETGITPTLPMPYTNDKWVHNAIVRSGNTISVYLNGMFAFSEAWTGSMPTTATSNLGIGCRSFGPTSNSDDMAGFLQDVRIYNGVAKYTENFIPPSSQPDLVPDTPSGAVHKTDFNDPFTGSVSFDGSTDRLSIADSADFDQPADFTLEYYVYFGNHSGNQVPVGRGIGWITLQSVAGNLTIVRYGQSALANGLLLHSDRWYHFALVRSGSSLTAFVDGVPQLTATDSTAVDISNALAIGSNDSSGSDPLEGFVSNVRFIKGTALYTSDFTPPREPLSNVTNTKLLCCQTIDNPLSAEVTPASLTANGNPKASTFNPLDNNTETILGDAGNYCVLSQLLKTKNCSIQKGGLRLNNNGTNDGAVIGNIPMFSGKWYWEITKRANPQGPECGIVPVANPGGTGIAHVARQTQMPANNVFEVAVLTSTTNTIRNGQNGNSTPALGNNYDPAGTLGMAVDMDRGFWYVTDLNGRWLMNGDPENGTGHVHNLNGLRVMNGCYPWILLPTGSGHVTDINFGQFPFKYNPPKGFKALTVSNVSNIGSKAAYDPENYFNTVIYPGDDDNTTNRVVGFQPDLVWIKNRTDSGEGSSNHMLYDSLRGTNDHLMTDRTDAESSNVNGLQEYTADGFRPGSLTRTNSTGRNYVAWCWKAGDNDTITYTVKVVSDSGNKYRFNDFGASAVTLELQEGRTFIFDQSDASNSGHPIRFSTTSDGTHGGGSEFTTGVTVEGTPGSAGARTIITVPAGTATLHYYCSVHSGMGGQANTPERGTSNFDGTIQSNITTSTESGFSIVTWNGTGAVGSIGHGLTNTPKILIIKSLNRVASWVVWSPDLSADHVLHLNSPDNEQNQPDCFQATEVTNSLINLGTGAAADTNQDTTATATPTHVAYCWAEIEGFSKFGTYQSNVDDQGPYVNCGFKPAMVIFKSVSEVTSESWKIADNKRAPSNLSTGLRLNAQTSNSETTHANEAVDFLSNGFKIRGTSNSINAPNINQTFIYMAWAEAPSINLYGAQASAT